MTIDASALVSEQRFPNPLLSRLVRAAFSQRCASSREFEFCQSRHVRSQEFLLPLLCRPDSCFLPNRVIHAVNRCLVPSPSGLPNETRKADADHAVFRSLQISWFRLRPTLPGPICEIRLRAQFLISIRRSPMRAHIFAVSKTTKKRFPEMEQVHPRYR